MIDITMSLYSVHLFKWTGILSRVQSCLLSSIQIQDPDQDKAVTGDEEINQVMHPHIWMMPVSDKSEEFSAQFLVY